MKRMFTVIGMLFITAATCQAEPEYSTQPLVRGLRKPVKYVLEDGRAFIVEQAGLIKSVVGNTIQPLSFLDIKDRVYSSDNETGLLGLALHPQYASNGRFFVNYTAKVNNQLKTRISEFRKDTNGQVNTAEEKIILTFDQPFSNHNGGDVAFGPDGFLYIGTGDGGAANDPNNAGQRMNTLLAKMLRIDVDRQDAGRAYAIPGDNPFKDRADALPEIYAYGLRNPWRFSFDTATGMLWAGDVGQNIREEIDIIRKGGNYGWRKMEGGRCFNTNTCDQTGLENPIFDYDHNEGEAGAIGQSVTGGLVYHGAKLPALQGKYIYGDYVSGNIWALTYDAQSGTATNTLLMTTALSPSAFAESADGDMLIIDHGGAVHKVVFEEP